MSCPALRQQPSGQEWIVAGQRGALRIRATDVTDARLLTVGGELDAITYSPLRDTIVKAARDEPPAVIIDVTDLTARDDPAWAVFTTARWQIAEWPDVPMGLVCAHDHGQNALQRNGITRYVPVYTTLQTATVELAADELRRYRRRAHAALPAMKTSIHRSRELIAEWLTAWSRTDFIHAVSAVTTELVELALANANNALSLRVESDGSTVAVAVQHVDIGKTRLRQSVDDAVSGLDLVAANCRVWGSYTSAAGDTVWAVVGPENRF
jgi:hypothetical protein